MAKKKAYPKLKDLNEFQRAHLAWRLEHNTCCGYGTANMVSRLDTKWANNLTLNDVFEQFDCTSHQAKILATRTLGYPFNFHAINDPMKRHHIIMKAAESGLIIDFEKKELIPLEKGV
jgi:hypothetical protein